MTKYTPATAHAQAERGARWMDTHYPGWVNMIDLPKLEMRNGNYCVLGQAAPLIGAFDFDSALNSIGFTSRWATINGFLVDPFHVDTRYEMLTIAWREQIRNRLEQLANNPQLYEAQESPYGWEVRRGNLLIAETRTPRAEAEAKIIEWALNNAAEGKELAAVSNLKNVDGRYEVDSFYDGPTEGTAP
jgi:hypothetical protein